MENNNNNNNDKKTQLTTSSGSPVENNQHSLTVGTDGPTLLQDFHLIDKIAHFDRERIPERVVHAKGAGAHGFFEVTDDISKFCKAKLFDTIGKKTPVFIRFSTVGGEKGSADTERDPRGFAMKFYTEEGNWDFVGNNTPVFFIRDPMKFPDFVHTQKKHPQTNLRNADMVWDFLSLHPESSHQVTVLFSDRGIPDGYRQMNGYSGHTFKWVNADGEVFFVKWHFKTTTGIKCLDPAEATRLAGTDPDYSTRDLFEHIQKGNTSEWTFFAQIMPEKEAANYRWNILDMTKIWPHTDYPLIKVGRVVLNRNPENYFAETEQSAFNPAHVVPGIEFSNDKMLQGRLFSYPDTQRHRLGANYQQIPINCPYRARVANHQRDGPATINGNGGSLPNYEPNSFAGPVENVSHTIGKSHASGHFIRQKTDHKNDDFIQAGDLYARVMNPSQKTLLINNLTGAMKGAQKFVKFFLRNFKNIFNSLLILILL
jgi:catalase